MNGQIKDLFTGLGALSETLWYMYERLEEQGFREDQALYLTGKMLQAMIPKQGANDE